MNAIKPIPIVLSLADITLDPDLQPRARIDQPTWEDYLHALADGATFPPIVVFRDGARYWLADGFHRWHAHKAAGRDEIAALITNGTREDALRFALGANAIHGKRREPGDYRSAYERACAHRLVAATDAAGVQALLRCTTQWAYRLTEAARAEADIARDSEIAERKAAGQSNRAIARDVGLDRRTVDRAGGGAKFNSLGMPHPDEPRPKHPAQAEFEDMTSERGQLWGALYEVLQAINRLAPADRLFADRYTRLDQAIAPALREAQTRINEIHGRFFDV